MTRTWTIPEHYRENISRKRVEAFHLAQQMSELKQKLFILDRKSDIAKHELWEAVHEAAPEIPKEGKYHSEFGSEGNWEVTQIQGNRGLGDILSGLMGDGPDKF